MSEAFNQWPDPAAGRARRVLARARGIRVASRSAPGAGAIFLARVLAALLPCLVLLSCGEEKPAAPSHTNPLDDENPATLGDGFSLTAEVQGSAVVLRWNRVPIEGIAECRVYRKAAGQPSVPVTIGIVPGDQTTFTDTSARRALRYGYQVRGADAAGQEFPKWSSAMIEVSTNPLLSIADGAATTTRRKVKLTIRAIGGTAMRLSNSPDLSGASWRPFVEELPEWILAEGPGTKTVHVQVRFGPIETSEVVSDAIAPAPIEGATITLDGGAIGTCDDVVFLAAAAQGADSIRIANAEAELDASRSMALGEAFVVEAWQLPGGAGARRVWAEFRNDFHAARASAAIEIAGVLGTPQNVQAIPTCGTISLSWEAVEGATGYRVYRGDESSPAATVAGGSTVTWDDRSPRGGPRRYWVSAARLGHPSGCGEGERSDPSAEVETPCAIIGSVDTPGWALDLDVSGAHAFVADESSGLQVIDITDPEAPRIVGDATPGDYALAVAVSGTQACVAGGSGDIGPYGLLLIDVADPAHARIVGGADVFYPSDVAISGTHAYVTDEYYGLLVIDLSDPANLRTVGRVGMPSTASGVAVSGSHVYVAAYRAGLKIVDISAPSSPVIVGGVDTPGTAVGVAVSGTYAYVADGQLGLQVIDTADVGNPRIVGAVDTPGSALDISVSGTRAFVADGSSGLQVIDVSDPLAPWIVGGVYTPGGARGVAVSGPHVYVADGRYGLQVIRVPEVP